MQETGQVIALDKGRAVVRLDRREKCGECTACRSFGDGTMRLFAENPHGAQVGDWVTVAVEPQQVIGNSLLVFIFPILALIGGYAVGRIFFEPSGSSESTGIIGAIGGLFVSAGVLKWIDWRRSDSPLGARIVSLTGAQNGSSFAINSENNPEC
ncbi:SoxR reducing system RseC family protein [candidate division KSB1 bacterium]|nr:SoxR reducing system RseC family protein [candidate division KSB1 bacterium]